jgi:hypothetical protein
LTQLSCGSAGAWIDAGLSVLAEAGEMPTGPVSTDAPVTMISATSRRMRVIAVLS